MTRTGVWTRPAHSSLRPAAAPSPLTQTHSSEWQAHTARWPPPCEESEVPWGSRLPTEGSIFSKTGLEQTVLHRRSSTMPNTPARENGWLCCNLGVLN